MNDTDEPTDETIRQYEAIRQSGATNMFDRRRVRELAEQMGMDALADAASDNRSYVAILEHYQREGRP